MKKGAGNMEWYWWALVGLFVVLTWFPAGMVGHRWWKKFWHRDHMRDESFFGWPGLLITVCAYIVRAVTAIVVTAVDIVVSAVTGVYFLITKGLGGFSVNHRKTRTRIESRDIYKLPKRD